MKFDATLICLLAGPVITMIVQWFKNLSFVATYPKVVAAILSVLVGVVSGFTFHGLDWTLIAECILVPFLSSIGSYELYKTAKKEESF